MSYASYETFKKIKWGSESFFEIKSPYIIHYAPIELPQKYL